MNNNCMNRQKLMRKIQQHGFAMLEAALYLDGHPNCPKALRYYNMQRDHYMRHVSEYESAYGPLTIKGNTGDSWKWVQGPWPWESEAN